MQMYVEFHYHSYHLSTFNSRNITMFTKELLVWVHFRFTQVTFEKKYL